MKHLARILLPFLLLGMTSIWAMPMSIKQTVEAKLVTSAITSPDGRFIAYTVSVPRKVYKDKDGKAYAELHLVDLKGNSRKFIGGKVNVSAVQWSPDSHYIYYLAKRNDDEYTAVYRIAVDGGESEKLVSHGNNISGYSINHKGDKLVFWAKPAKDKSEKVLKEKGFKAKVYEESVKIAEAWLVDLNKPEDKPTKLAINEHILSASFSPVNDLILARVAPTALIDDNYMASQYKIFDLQGEIKQHFKTKGKLGTAKWSPDGKRVAIIGAEDEHDPATGRIFIAEVKSGKLVEPVKNYLGHFKDAAWLAEHKLALLGHKGTVSELSVLNIDSNKRNINIDGGDVVLTHLSVSQNGQVVAAIGSSDKHPNEVFAINNGKLARLTDVNPWLKDIDLPRQETINITARDGLALQGVLIYPIDYQKGKRYPLIMMVHGGPESHVSDAWLDRYSYPIKYAAANGYAILLPNYRGSTGRGVEFSKMGQADYAGGEFNDLVDYISALDKQGLIDKKRVGITGGSYGGYASAWAATALSEHFAASVMFVGISDQLSKFGTTDIPKEMYNVHARNYPWDKWMWMLERSPIYHTDKAKTPILIMHGDSDTRVHPSQSMELYRYIKTRTDTPVRLVFYPGEGHGNRKTAAQYDYAIRLMRWMDFYLKGNPKKGEMPPYEVDHKTALDKQSEKS